MLEREEALEKTACCEYGNSFMVDLSITIKSYQFVGNKYSASDFFEETKKYSKLLLDTL